MYRNNDIDYLNYLKKKKVVIFGAGQNGKKGLAGLRRERVEVVAFCDNNEKKQGQEICGIAIISFEKLCEMNNDNIIIVICSDFEREIKRQLMDANIHNFISILQIDFGGGEEYYDESYFSYQQEIGMFGGKIKADMLSPHIKEDMVVIDFGSGGGYLLDCINVKEKIGIEINDTAREAAKRMGVNSVKNISDIPDRYADLIVSTGTLEHVEHPLKALRELRDKLKDGGKIVFYVPNESCDTEYTRSDVNNHLYTWNCLTLGNLFKAAGYFIYSVEKVQEMWPPHYLKIKEEVSPEFFEAICGIAGRVFNENRCLIVGYK